MPTYEVRYTLNGQTLTETYTTPQATNGQAVIQAKYGTLAKVIYWHEVRDTRASNQQQDRERREREDQDRKQREREDRDRMRREDEERRQRSAADFERRVDCQKQEEKQRMELRERERSETSANVPEVKPSIFNFLGALFAEKEKWNCPKCGSKIDSMSSKAMAGNEFTCPGCGVLLTVTVCPHCFGNKYQGRILYYGFERGGTLPCPYCGVALQIPENPEKPEKWYCPKCGSKIDSMSSKAMAGEEFTCLGCGKLLTVTVCPRCIGNNYNYQGRILYYGSKRGGTVPCPYCGVALQIPEKPDSFPQPSQHFPPPAASIPEMASVLPDCRMFEENGHQYLQLNLGDGVTMRLVYIHSGTFVMGSPESEDGRHDNEGSQTQVTLTRDFWLGETPVTQAQWDTIMGKDANPGFPPGNPDEPVRFVAWEMAKEFCLELTLKMSSLQSPSISGLTFTFPTEAQWEYACRAGSTSRFCFGDRYAMLGDYAWYKSNSNSNLSPVKMRNPNAWGLCDMHGNVEEWCLDWYAGKLLGGSVTDPTGPSSGRDRVIRGGGYLSEPWKCRSAYRSSCLPGDQKSYVGFRIVAADQ